MRKAFTIIELIMVMIVLGIVASIGADILSNLYDNYIKTRSINRLQTQAEIVLEQISKRLTFRIKDSVIGRSSTTYSDYVALPDANGSYQILEWIEKDNDSFRGEYNGSINRPGWSGFVDLDSNETNKSQIKTSGSELNITDSLIKALSYNKVSLDSTNPNRPAIVFKGKTSYDISEYGWNGTDGNYTIKVQYNSSKLDILELIDSYVPSDFFEQYDFTWSAYAIVPEGSGNDFNLTLYYNYQPWENESYNDGNSTVLIEHVSTFRFSQLGETIRIKLCIHDNNRSGNFDYAICREKVVF